MQPFTFASCCVSPQVGQTVVSASALAGAGCPGAAGRTGGAIVFVVDQQTTAVPLTLTMSMPLFCPSTS